MRFLESTEYCLRGHTGVRCEASLRLRMQSHVLLHSAPAIKSPSNIDFRFGIDDFDKAVTLNQLAQII